MCGFVGFIGKQKNKDEIITDMMNTIVHRGPDGEGKYIDNNIALGHRRLSIIDVNETANQPMFNYLKNKVLVFNGEIYNYQDLKEKLVEAGHTFATNSDSEVLIHGYEEWGEELVLKLRGMYAFVIWDINKKELFGARDMFGIKPFYYANMDNSFMFGSEIKSFLKHPDFVKEFNEDVLGLYLSFQFVPTNETFFKGVYCLEPGHFFKIDSKKKMQITRYFDPLPDANNDKSLEEITDDIENVMKDSVKAHMVSDVEVASYLSSGIDSSYMAYLSQVDKTYTVGFEEGKYSEIDEAKQFADSINMKNESHIIDPDEYWDKLSDIMYYMDEPVADPAAIALYFLSRIAARDVKVVLSGEGSDELFGGYNIYCEPLEHKAFNIIPYPIRKVAAKIAEEALPVGTKGRGFLMRHGKKLEDRYFANATNIFTPKEARKLLKDKPIPKIQMLTKPLYDKVKDFDDVSKMQYIDMHLWLVHDILMKGDKMGMANSIEVRVPFLDKEVFNLAKTLPLDKKVVPPKTKVSLRKAANRVIQEKTADKKKLGFPIPTRVWLKEDKYYNIVKTKFESDSASKFFDTDILMELLDAHKNGDIANELVDNSRKIWAVYIFLVWYDRFFGEN